MVDLPRTNVVTGLPAPDFLSSGDYIFEQIARQASDFSIELPVRPLPAQTAVTFQTVDPSTTCTLEVNGEHEFVFVARKDDALVIQDLAPRIARNYGLSENRVRNVIATAYSQFSELALMEIARSFRDPLDQEPGVTPSGKVEVHVFDAAPLERGVIVRSGSMPVISLDPLVREGVHELAVSRLFHIGGMNAVGLTHRPGSAPLAEQCARLRERLGGQAALITDDDLYTGGTLKEVMRLLDVPVAGAIPQIQTGDPAVIESLGLKVNPVVTYEVKNRDSFDIGDVRDFLFGASGLVIQLPSGEQGRVPYVQPFISPAARASVHRDVARDFSANILQLNDVFFSTLERELGVRLSVCDLDPSLAGPLRELYDIPPDARVRGVISWAMRNMDTIWENTRRIGSIQTKLSRLELPERMVLLDVNGTLFPDSLSEPARFQPEQVTRLQHEVARLRDQGIEVGLCSDSPLEPLRSLAAQLGLGGPLIGENGNIIEYRGKKEAIRTLPARDALEELIRDYAAGTYSELDPVLSPEFGGTQPRYTNGEWAFGAGREVSISLFAPARFVEFLGKSLAMYDGYTVDCAPEHNFLGIHAGDNFRQNKGETLSILGLFGHSTLMIGNSASDWVQPGNGVQCAFVGDARISEEIRRSAVRIASGQCLDGVLEILAEVNAEPA